MKNLIILLLDFFLVVSCNPKMAGPVGYIFGFENYWKLGTYRVKGNVQPMELAGNQSYLSFPNNIKTDIFRFNFYDNNKMETFPWDVSDLHLMLIKRGPKVLMFLKMNPISILGQRLL